MSRDIAPLGIRMNPELRQAVEAMANESGRSLNLEVCRALEAWTSTTSALRRQQQISDLIASAAMVSLAIELDGEVKRGDAVAKMLHDSLRAVVEAEQ